MKDSRKNYTFDDGIRLWNTQAYVKGKKIGQKI